MIYLLSAIAVAAAVYQLTALLACLRQLLVRATPVRNLQSISILKPVRGLDPDFYEAIRSHAVQDYPVPFEILFGAADANDPSLAEIGRLRRDFPHLEIRVIHSTTQAANAKVGVLIDLAREARYPILLVNDSDILVPQGYLKKVVSPLDDPKIGIVTALYRATAHSTPGQWEALGIAIDFAPSVLVAPLVGIREFGLGATLVFRAADLQRIGGFHSIAEYLADDYQLARKITQLGKRSHMSEVVVETSIGDDSWDGVWKHQVRWARTIRVSRGDGYLGLPVTHTGLWILIAILSGAWSLALSLTILRWVTAFVGGVLVLRSPIALRGFWLAPLWDVWAFLVWMAGLTGNTVVWRDGVLKLTKDGRLLRQVS
ncbi:bacteriohopanetetrol glucosamine biosynthesis glycosyltransferase HpnI [Bryobacter aggregatus]|uniref:bacteriohopanetetrol glucosamine biosynthesis glycosyltransferase HpnI n=1 Tax=Bryobacter aggregatus TaxID=360054 RepID=UPI00068D2776|nr:bacteriohopanetetrol glucosamine biosynthesis glycosyltransferase HpnI [Bryobacter aggregatus]